MQLYTVKETSDLLKITEGTLRNWIYTGKIKAVKVNGATRIKEQDVLNIIEPLETKKGE